MFRRILAVGDVHGEADGLERLWKKIAFDDERDLLVFLGDYIDRGAAPVDCSSCSGRWRSTAMSTHSWATTRR